MKVKHIIEAALFASIEPLDVMELQSLFLLEERPSKNEVVECVSKLIEEYQTRPIELIETASGFRFQVKTDYSAWVARLWEEKPVKYSRALLETLAIIAYQQPATRGEIEEIRGVAVNTNIIRTLLERDWVRVIGHKEIPGRPALYATTKTFLDYFNLTTLADLPSLSSIEDLSLSEDQQLQLADNLDPSMNGLKGAGHENEQTTEPNEQQQTEHQNA